MIRLLIQALFLSGLVAFFASPERLLAAPRTSIHVSEIGAVQTLEDILIFQASMNEYGCSASGNIALIFGSKQPWGRNLVFDRSTWRESGGRKLFWDSIVLENLFTEWKRCNSDCNATNEFIRGSFTNVLNSGRSSNHAIFVHNYIKTHWMNISPRLCQPDLTGSLYRLIASDGSALGPRASPPSYSYGDREQYRLDASGKDLTKGPVRHFLRRLSHAPLLAQIIFFAALGGIAQSLLLGGGVFLLWHFYRSGGGDRWRFYCGLASFGCGLFAWGGTFWIINLS